MIIAGDLNRYIQSIPGRAEVLYDDRALCVAEE